MITCLESFELRLCKERENGQVPRERREHNFFVLVRKSEGNNEDFGTKIPYILLKFKYQNCPYLKHAHNSSLTDITLQVAT
jgi:hypothetical protein